MAEDSCLRRVQERQEGLIMAHPALNCSAAKPGISTIGNRNSDNEIPTTNTVTALWEQSRHTHEREDARGNLK